MGWKSHSVLSHAHTQQRSQRRVGHIRYDSAALCQHSGNSAWLQQLKLANIDELQSQFAHGGWAKQEATFPFHAEIMM